MSHTNNPHLILASQSVGRKMLLETLKIPFSVMPSNIDEDAIIDPDPIQTIRLRAKKKCEDTLNRIQKIEDRSKKLEKNETYSKFQLPTSNFRQQLVLSADSGAIIDGVIYGKPKSLENAVDILSALSGRVQTFITSSYIILLTKDIKNRIKSDVILDDIDTSFVTFKKLNRKEIDLYLSLTDYKKFAGAYALYTSPQFFIEKIEGSLSSVVGLPLEKVIPVFRKFYLI
jgi:septum formation protein